MWSTLLTRHYDGQTISGIAVGGRAMTVIAGYLSIERI